LTDREILIEQGQRFRAAIESKRSDTLVRLFDFLLERSFDPECPKESEIALAILGDIQGAIGTQGANIRVYILRLRRKLEEYYGGTSGERLIIPRGEYRIVLERPVADEATATPTLPIVARLASRLNRRQALVLCGILVANLALAGIVWTNRASAPASLGQSSLWAPLAGQAKATKVVVADYFLFGKRRGNGLPTEIIRDMSIASRDDYHNYISRGSGEVQDMVDLDLHFVSSNVVFALRCLWEAFRSVNGPTVGDVEIVPASQADPEILKAFNLIYVGPFDALDKFVRNPLFQMSGFRIGSTYNSLIDKASGQQFLADGAIPAGSQVPRKEFGYIALIPGPGAKHIIIISGTGDAATAQMADLAGDRTRLAELAKKLGRRTDAFEALYQVRTMYSERYGADLLIARRIHGDGAWDKSRASQIFPNELVVEKPKSRR
jgi:hypothetical protein